MPNKPPHGPPGGADHGLDVFAVLYGSNRPRTLGSTSTISIPEEEDQELYFSPYEEMFLDRCQEILSLAGLSTHALKAMEDPHD